VTCKREEKKNEVMFPPATAVISALWRFLFLGFADQIPGIILLLLT
jgi:hypothetical protein